MTTETKGSRLPRFFVKPSIVLIPIILALCLSLIFAGCAKEKVKTVTTKGTTDYSKAAHWMSLPAPVKPVDVFYLYPSAWQKAKPSDPNICEIDNPTMLKGANVAFARQATAFETVGNIYAPYYRQSDAATTLALPLADQAKVVGGIPATDAIAAFDYYIKHYNNGRPFILAGHSQGSNVLIFLLSKYMKANPKVYNRMIVAYVIGYSVTDKYLAANPHLKFAEGPDDTGVIVSYNTEAPGVEGKNPVVSPSANVINPINWTRTEQLATAQENLGSIALNKDGTVVFDKDGNIARVMNYADARIDKARGTLICSTADEEALAPGKPGGAPRGIYHTFDYPFYYFDIRANASNRTKNFLNK
jgi:hypothetical protein